jgi:signal transduction histidine kinase
MIFPVVGQVSPDFFLFLILAITLSSALVIVHALRLRITLAPLFVAAGAYVLLLWQFLEFGWWTSLGRIQINAAHCLFVPPLLLGATMLYAMDGLKTLRAYGIGVVAGGLLSWGIAGLREVLQGMVPMPYALVYSPRSHIALIASLSLALVATPVALELARRVTRRLAPPLALAAGLFVWLAVLSLAEYGWRLGIVNLRLHAPGLALSAAFPLVLAWLYGARYTQLQALLPARPVREILTFWRSVESNVHEQREEIMAANQVISDLRGLYQSLQESERLRDYQTEQSPVGIVVTDGHGTIRRMNPAAAALFADPSGGCVGQSLSEVLAARSGTSVSLPQLAEQPGGHTISVEGSPTRWYDLTVLSTFDARKQPTGYQVMLKEVTAREAAQRRLLMESRVREIHKTGKVLAHDFSNLLMGTQATLEALAHLLAGQEDAMVHLGHIRQGLVRGREMLSRLHSATLFTPVLKRQDLGELLAEASRLSEAAAARAGISLCLDPLPEVLWVDADASQLVRVFTNLIGNAIRVTPPGGEIRLRAEREKDSGGAVAKVIDNGAGMTPEQIQRAFDPGFTTKGDGIGGLGLSISYLMVDAHGGTLQIAPNPEPGVTVSVWLPESLAPVAGPLGERQGIMFALSDASRLAGWLEAFELAGAPLAEILQPEEIAALLADDRDTWGVLVVDPAFAGRLPPALDPDLLVVRLAPEGDGAPLVVQRGTAPQALFHTVMERLSGSPA